MEKLPPELIEEILHHIPSKFDLGNFRLVQKSFAELANKFTFKAIHILPNPQGLDPLNHVSQRPVLACCVRKVVLQLNHLFETIYVPLRDRAMEQDNPSISSEFLVNLAQQSMDFQASSEYVSMLLHSFQRLPGLEEIKMTADRRPVSHNLYPDLARNYNLRPFTVRNHDCFFGFSALIGAAHGAKLKLVSFQSEVGIEFHSDTKYWIDIVRYGPQVFQTCQSIRLSHFPCDRNPFFWILRHAKQLETIDIQFSEFFKNPEGAIVRLFHHGPFPCLQELKLRKARARDSELMEFVGKHRGTLRRLSIMDGILLKGSWVDIIDFLESNLDYLDFLEMGVLTELGGTTADYRLGCRGRITKWATCSHK